jgi:hypothetical protein
MTRVKLGSSDLARIAFSAAVIGDEQRLTLYAKLAEERISSKDIPNSQARNCLLIAAAFARGGDLENSQRLFERARSLQTLDETTVRSDQASHLMAWIEGGHADFAIETARKDYPKLTELRIQDRDYSAAWRAASQIPETEANGAEVGAAIAAAQTRSGVGAEAASRVDQIQGLPVHAWIDLRGAQTLLGIAEKYKDAGEVNDSP